MPLLCTLFPTLIASQKSRFVCGGSGQNIVSSRSLGVYDRQGLASGNQCGAEPITHSAQATQSLLSMQGTSMATPVAAGTAALVRQYFVEGRWPNTFTVD
jgi:subtilisin family serine protease